MLNVVYLLGAPRITSLLFIWGDNLSLAEAHMTADRHKTLQIKIHILRRRSRMRDAPRANTNSKRSQMCRESFETGELKRLADLTVGQRCVLVPTRPENTQPAYCVNRR